MKRSLTILLTLFALTMSALGITTPAAAVQKTADLPSAAEFLNADGTLNLSSGYTGALDISAYTVTLDPAHGPFFSPPQTLTPNTWNALGTGVNNDVNAIAISGTDVYAGGLFTDAGGDANADKIAKWNGSAWSALGGTPLNNMVYAITISGTDVYAGGGFTNAGGDANADYIAKWNGSAWSALGGTPLNNWVNAIAISGTDVYAGGIFTDAGGDANADYIAKWNGSAWSALGGTPLSDSVQAITISGTDVYAGGEFTDAGGDANADHIAKWNGSAWSALGGTPLNSHVYAIATSGTDVYAGGYFTDAGGDANADWIAKWNGSTWSALGGTPLNGGILAIAINGTDVYAGGQFSNAGGVASADYIAKWNGSAWSALGPGLGSYVAAIAIRGTDVYAGGAFLDAGGDANADKIAVYVVVKTLSFKSIAANDGWVLESTETSGVGGTLNASATTFNLGDAAADKQYRALLHFDTSSLADNAVITKVTLKIKKQGQVGTNPFTILSGLRVDMRKPAFGTVALAIGDFQAAAGKTSVATFGVTPVRNWYSAVLNGPGRAYVNKTGTTQFRLLFATDDNNDNGADYMKFFSGNAPAATRPQLIIEYTIP